jgi:hypothetical protein
MVISCLGNSVVDESVTHVWLAMLLVDEVGLKVKLPTNLSYGMQ